MMTVFNGTILYHNLLPTFCPLPNINVASSVLESVS